MSRLETLFSHCSPLPGGRRSAQFSPDIFRDVCEVPKFSSIEKFLFCQSIASFKGVLRAEWDATVNDSLCEYSPLGVPEIVPQSWGGDGIVNGRGGRKFCQGRMKFVGYGAKDSNFYRLFAAKH